MTNVIIAMMISQLDSEEARRDALALGIAISFMTQSLRQFRRPLFGPVVAVDVFAYTLEERAALSTACGLFPCLLDFVCLLLFYASLFVSLMCLPLCLFLCVLVCLFLFACC